MESWTETLRRWYHGEAVAGAALARSGAVEITDGTHAGERARVIALERLDPPTYLLQLSTGRNLMVLGSALRPAP